MSRTRREGAAPICRDEVEYVPGYSGRPPDVAALAGRSILLVDYCWDGPTIEALLAVDASVTVIDHHLTAERATRCISHPRFTRFFDMRHSAAVLAWRAFQLIAPPTLLRHVEDYDLFRMDLPGTDEINLALTSRPFDFGAWDRLDVDSLRSEGEAILRWVTMQVGRIASSAGRCAVEGYDVPCANAPCCLVDRLGHRLAEGEPFAVVWAETSNAVHFSLRSTASGVSVNGIAERLGGRGHEHAAVFSLPWSPEALGILGRSPPR